MDKNNNDNGKMGIASWMLILFIALKLIGVIDWPWFWVLSPAWIPCLIWLVVFALIIIFVR